MAEYKISGQATTDPQYRYREHHEILQDIRDLDDKISLLNKQKQHLLRELKSAAIYGPAMNIPDDFSPQKTIRLFEELFRGRTDVYAKYWVSRKTGRSGYSPVCKNEWVPKICQKGMATLCYQGAVLMTPIAS